MPTHSNVNQKNFLKIPSNFFLDIPLDWFYKYHKVVLVSGKKADDSLPGYPVIEHFY